MRVNGRLIRADLGPVTCKNNLISFTFHEQQNGLQSPFYREPARLALDLSFDAQFLVNL